jgi:hypothetical protein
LYIARNSSRGRPEFVSHTENGYKFEMTTVPKGLEHGLARIGLRIVGELGTDVKAHFRQSKFGQDEKTALHKYGGVPLLAEDSTAGLYYTEFSTLARGDRFYYYFEVRDNTGGLRASFTNDDGKPFLFRFIGEVPSYILVPHIFLMFATVFCLVMAFLHSFKPISGGATVRPLAIYVFLAMLCSFLGGYPWGIGMNYYAFGGIWEGVPFGTDATDNKTQLLFVYLLFLTLATVGSLRKKPDRDLFTSKALGWFGVGGFGLMLAIYLIPHSIQFGVGLTKTVCWSFIALVALLYLVGWLMRRKLRRKQPAPKRRT